MWLLELPSKHESDLQDLVDWGRKWPVDFIAGKTQVLSFDQSNNINAIDVKMVKKMLELAFSSKLDWCSYIISIA